MSVPGRVEAAAVLLSLDPPPWHLRHSRAVAEVAAFLAARIAACGTALDRPLVEAAALLHDVDKLVGAADPAHALGHGAGSAAWLAERGFPELAPAVAAHPVTRLLDPEAAEAWLAGAPLEERVVGYADKRAGQRLEPMAARFGSWRRRYPQTIGDRDGDGWAADVAAAVRERAERLERDVCALAGLAPQDVRRLAWTGPAIRAARVRGTPASAVRPDGLPGSRRPHANRGVEA